MSKCLIIKMYVYYHIYIGYKMCVCFIMQLLPERASTSRKRKDSTDYEFDSDIESMSVASHDDGGDADVATVPVSEALPDITTTPVSKPKKKKEGQEILARHFEMVSFKFFCMLFLATCMK